MKQSNSARKKLHVRKGDQVIVISGKEKGKQGAVLKVDSKNSRVIIEKVNFVKRHTRPSQSNPQGGIVEKEGSIHSSNVMLWCGKCNQATRVKREELKEGGKGRVCRNCGEMFTVKGK